MKNRTKVSKLLKGFIAMIQTQFDKKVKVVRNDNGLEFTSGPMHGFYFEHGILQESSYVHTPQQNGRVEHKHRHTLNVARALRFQAFLPIQFWGNCVLTATYLINCTPTKLLKGKSPNEAIYGCGPSYNEIRVFGSLRFAWNNPRMKDEFASRNRKCVFLGYPFGKKGWRVCDLETNETFISRDVVFWKSQFPFTLSDQQNASDLGTLWKSNVTLEDEFGPNENLALPAQHPRLEEARE